MQGKEWANVFRRIPANYHDDLILATITGAEIVMQNIIRLETDFVILRGRAAGTNEAGKIVVLPFEHLNYLAFKSTLSEDVVAGLFGAPDQNFATMPENLAKANGKPAETNIPRGRPVETKPVGKKPEDAAKAKDDDKASKAMLLARIRERLNNDSSKPHR